MNKRKPIKTTPKEIVDYLDGIINESELSIDFVEAGERCFILEKDV